VAAVRIARSAADRFHASAVEQHFAPVLEALASENQ